MQYPEGMIPVEEFAKVKGITPEKAISMIKDGFYMGRLVEEQWFASLNEVTSGVASETQNIAREQGENTPLIVLFYVLAGLSLLFSLIIGGQFWPGDPGWGNEWKTIAYVESFIWFIAGVIQCAFFTAIGKGLSYLKQIASNTSPES
ncbi:hypothetical protein N9193_03670, partial [Pseudomonadales bacterium]|nr:hypothetical protein [Pseudomonadales bacterium]